MSICESSAAPIAAKSLRVSMNLYEYLALACEHCRDSGDEAHAPLSRDVGFAGPRQSPVLTAMPVS